MRSVPKDLPRRPSVNMSARHGFLEAAEKAKIYGRPEQAAKMLALANVFGGRPVYRGHRAPKRWPGGV